MRAPWRWLERSDTEMVVGSKAMVGFERSAAAVPARGDARLQRHAALTCRFPARHARPQGFRRSALLETARRCVLDRDVFASEFVIRSPRGQEGPRDPVRVREKRPP